MKALAEKKALASGSSGSNSDALLQRLSSTAFVLQARTSDESSRSIASSAPPPDALPEGTQSGCRPQSGSETEAKHQAPVTRHLL